jgi:hypothetical protein
LLHTQNDSYPFRREEIIADSATISFNRSFQLYDGTTAAAAVDI